MLAAVLLCTATGLVAGVGKTPEKRVPIALGAAIVTAFGVLWLPHPGVPAESAFLAVWIAIAVCATATLIGEHIPRIVTLPLAAVAGGVTGLLAIDWRTLIALAAFPIVFLVSRRVSARTHVPVLKVVAGWLLAVAALNASLAMLPVTPGYLPDHLE